MYAARNYTYRKKIERKKKWGEQYIYQLLLIFLIHNHFSSFHIIIISFSGSSNSSSSSSTSSSIIIIIIIISSSSINSISVLLTISTFIDILHRYVSLLFYINIPHHYFFNKGLQWKKVTQLCSVIPAIAPNGEFFTTVFNFDDFVFLYVVNIRFICDGKIYLLTFEDIGRFSSLWKNIIRVS